MREHYCAECGGYIINVFGGWMHIVPPRNSHPAWLDNHRQNGYTEDMNELTDRRENAIYELENAERNLRIAQARVARAKEAVRATSIPREPATDTTIQIKVQYRPGETTYTYIAYRTPQGDWLITGSRYAGKKLTWEDVVKLADKNHSRRANLRILS